MNGQVQVLRDDRAMRGLTVKQYEYVLQRLEGLGVTDAYTAAYEVGEGVARPTVTVMAAQVEANPKVQALLRERLMEREAVYEGLPVISRDFVLTGIAALAVSGDKESTRLKGYELLGKARRAGPKSFADHLVRFPRVMLSGMRPKELGGCEG